MSRLFFFILLLVLCVWQFRRLFKRSDETEEAEKNKQEQIERMVSCAHCGLHLPESESIVINQVHYCCKKHLNEHSAP